MEPKLKDFDETEITGIAENSKMVKPGYLFIVKPGGERFIAKALDLGARVICKLSEQQEKTLLESFYQNASRSLFVVGITGTNGKTTTSFLVRRILGSCGVIGSLGAFMEGSHVSTFLTTPDLATNHRLVYEMKEKGCKSVAMEVSSHALVQNRTLGIDFDVAIFTNLSHEHLDYHRTMKEYFAAKCKLFAGLSENKVAIINLDDPYSNMIQTRAKILTYGIERDADVRAHHLRPSLSQTTFDVTYQKQTERFILPLPCRFNVYNALAAISVGIVRGISLSKMAKALQGDIIIPGRMEAICLNKKKAPFIYVDHAHKPQALEQVLAFVQPFKRGRVITLFGCGGDRDQDKRSMMAKIAERYSDLVIVTSDNPRKENPNAIIQEIVRGFKKNAYMIEPDRKRAIEKAILQSEPEDMIIIAGKGHETVQIIADKTIPFDDRKVAKECLLRYYS